MILSHQAVPSPDGGRWTVDSDTIAVARLERSGRAADYHLPMSYWSDGQSRLLFAAPMWLVAKWLAYIYSVARME